MPEPDIPAGDCPDGVYPSERPIWLDLQAHPGTTAKEARERTGIKNASVHLARLWRGGLATRSGPTGKYRYTIWSEAEPPAEVREDSSTTRARAGSGDETVSTADPGGCAGTSASADREATPITSPADSDPAMQRDSDEASVGPAEPDRGTLPESLREYVENTTRGIQALLAERRTLVATLDHIGVPDGPDLSWRLGWLAATIDGITDREGLS